MKLAAGASVADSAAAELGAAAQVGEEVVLEAERSCAWRWLLLHVLIEEQIGTRLSGELDRLSGGLLVDLEGTLVRPDCPVGAVVLEAARCCCCVFCY